MTHTDLQYRLSAFLDESRRDGNRERERQRERDERERERERGRRGEREWGRE